MTPSVYRLDPYNPCCHCYLDCHWAGNEGSTTAQIKEEAGREIESDRNRGTTRVKSWAVCVQAKADEKPCGAGL